jgi:hypothetical protein
MKISRHSRKFNDPWGNSWGNTAGSVIRYQYQVSKSMLIDHDESIHRANYYLDKTTTYEGLSSKFFHGRWNIEKLRR